MEIKLYLRMLQRGWWIVALTILVAINVALISDYFTQPTYQASARFSVSPSSIMSTTGQEVLSSMEALDKRSIIQTYAEFLNSQRIYDETLRSMSLTPENMVKYVRTTVVLPEANVLELTFVGPDPKMVAILANNTGQSAITNIKQLYKIYDINVLDPALVPVIPISPQPLRDAGVAALLGVVFGAILAITSEQLRGTLDTYRQRASLDPISMVLNRRYLQHRMDELAIRNPEGVTALGLAQLSGLNDLIDTLPQGVVQMLMRKVAATLQKELRGNDLIGRWNETTFALVLPETSETAATRTMERIRTALLKPVNLENYGETFHLDPLVSVASYKEGDATSDVTRRAEDALERSHKTGDKNTVVAG
jgi:diguanylate cyclase (GGDEF)-like protein